MSGFSHTPETGIREIGFEADVAQLVEQLIRNQQVIGSSPIVGSIKTHSFEPFPFLVPAPSLVPSYPLLFSRIACDRVSPLRIIATEAEVRG